MLSGRLGKINFYSTEEPPRRRIKQNYKEEEEMKQEETQQEENEEEATPKKKRRDFFDKWTKKKEKGEEGEDKKLHIKLLEKYKYYMDEWNDREKNILPEEIFIKKIKLYEFKRKKKIIQHSKSVKRTLPLDILARYEDFRLKMYERKERLEEERKLREEEKTASPERKLELLINREVEKIIPKDYDSLNINFDIGKKELRLKDMENITKEDIEKSERELIEKLEGLKEKYFVGFEPHQFPIPASFDDLDLTDDFYQVTLLDYESKNNLEWRSLLRLRLIHEKMELDQMKDISKRVFRRRPEKAADFLKLTAKRQFYHTIDKHLAHSMFWAFKPGMSNNLVKNLKEGFEKIREDLYKVKKKIIFFF